MAKTNWKSVSKIAKSTKQRSKNIALASSYLSEKPADGYFIDNISKKEVKISECKSSTLRRYVKALDKYYQLITSPVDRDYLLKKKLEIEAELATRPDGEIAEN